MTTPHKQRLLEAVQSCNQWISRRQLAYRLGVKRLSSADIVYLEMLVDEGEIQVDRVSRAGAIPFEYRYKAILLADSGNNIPQPDPTATKSNED